MGSHLFGQKKVDPVLTKTVGWNKVILLDFQKSHIYLFWLIFKLPATMSWVISHSIIVLASLRFFILNLFMSWSFSYSNTLRLFDPKTRLFIYIIIIISSLFYLMIRMQAFTLVGIKLIFWKNLVIILFQSFPACVKLYKVFNILQTSPSQPAR